MPGLWTIREQSKSHRQISAVVVKAKPSHVRGALHPNDYLWSDENIYEGLVLHGTAGGGTVSWFQNPSSQVSAHYVVEQDGRIVQMVSEDDTAWHNGE